MTSYLAKRSLPFAALLVAVAVRAADEAEGGHAGGGLMPDVQMVIWTWVVFILLALILYKFAFKPILQGLDQREAKIRDGVEKAERARAELARIEETRAELIRAAEEQGKKIVEESRKAAREAARTIEEKAKEETQIMMENARREIRIAVESARADLRRESSALVIGLASKVIEENLDDPRNHALVNRLINEI